VATGCGDLWFRGFAPSDFINGRIFASGDWGHVLAAKLVIVGTVLVLSVTHDFWIGPRAVRLARETSGSGERERSRKMASWAGRVNFLLSLAILALALQLVR
jgi:hypothetical protein